MLVQGKAVKSREICNFVQGFQSDRLASMKSIRRYQTRLVYRKVDSPNLDVIHVYPSRFADLYLEVDSLSSKAAIDVSRSRFAEFKRD